VWIRVNMHRSPDQSRALRRVEGAIRGLEVRSRALGLFAVLCLGPACKGACGASPEPTAAHRAPPGPSQALVLGTVDEPTTLDPAFVHTSSGRLMLGLIHRGLLRFDEQGRVQPSLAAALPRPTASATTSRVEVAWDLRPRYWEDGRPVTAADLRFAWALERRGEVKAVNHHLAKSLVDLKVEGARRFTAVWPEPKPTLIAPGTHTLLPAHAYPEPRDGAPFDGQGRRPLSNGPYRLATWTPGVEARFEPNPHWPGPEPALRSILVRFYASEDALLLALMRGEIDAVGEGSGLGGRKALIAKRELRDSHALHRTDGGLWVHLIFDLDHPVMARPEFRQWLHRGLDREALAAVYGGDAAAPSFGLFPRNHPAGGRQAAPPPPTPELEAQVEAIARDQPSIDLFIASESQRSADLAAVLAQTLARVGFVLEIRALPFAVLNERLRARQLNGMALYGWRVRPDWDAYSILHPEGRQNFNGFADPEATAALEASQATADPEAWRMALKRVEQRFREELPAMPLLLGQALSLRPRWLVGWQPTGTTTPVTWNAETWSVDQTASLHGRRRSAHVRSEAP